MHEGRATRGRVGIELESARRTGHRHMEPSVVDHPELEMLCRGQTGQPPSDANRSHECRRALGLGEPIATHPNESASPHGGLHGVLRRPSPVEVVAVGDAAVAADERHKIHASSITDATCRLGRTARRRGNGDTPQGCWGGVPACRAAVRRGAVQENTRCAGRVRLNASCTPAECLQTARGAAPGGAARGSAPAATRTPPRARSRPARRAEAPRHRPQSGHGVRLRRRAGRAARMRRSRPPADR